MYTRPPTEKMKDQAFKKMRSYCDYQPRSHKEVREKLYSLGLWKRDVEEVLCQLIVDGYVNEGKFATSYTAEKFTSNKWGRMKIQNRLKQRNVGEGCIKIAMKEINEEIYIANLNTHARKKWDSVKGVGANLFVKMRKTGNYLLQKGFESHLVWEALAKLKKGEI